MKIRRLIISICLCFAFVVSSVSVGFAWNGIDPSDHKAAGIGNLHDGKDATWIDDCWRPVGVGGGGGTFQPTFSPLDPALWFAACDMGGAYVSFDAGYTWAMLNFGSTSTGEQTNAAFFFDLNDENIVYASMANAGLWKSVDKGKDWTRIFPHEDESVVMHRGDHADVYYLSPGCPDHGCGIRTVTDPGRNYPASANNAKDWVGYPTCDPPGGFPYQGRSAFLAIDPVNSNILWTVVRQAIGQNAGTLTRDFLYRSEDGGRTFELIAEDITTYNSIPGYPFNDAVFNITTQSRNVTGMIVEPVSGDVFVFFAASGGIKRYGADGSSSVVSPLYGSTVVNNIGYADFIYDKSTGEIAYYLMANSYIYKSTDGLATLERMTRGTNTLAGGSAEQAVQGMALGGLIDGKEVIWYRNGSNVFRTADGGASWAHVWRGINSRPGTAIDPDRWMGFGSEGSGWQEYAVQFGSGWSGGIGSGFNASQADPLVCGGSGLGYMICTRNGGDLWGQTYTKIVHGFDDRGNQVDTWVSTGFNVTTTYGVHFDPFNPLHCFMSITDVGLFQSWDGGYSWRHSGVSGMFPSGYTAETINSWAGSTIGNGANYGNWSNTCYWVTFDPLVPDRVYSVWSNTHDCARLRYFPPRNAGSQTGLGGVAISTDGGRNWQPVNYTAGTATSSGLPTNIVPMHIEVGPANEETGDVTLYIATHGSGFFKSENSGLTWKKINNRIDPVVHHYAQNKTTNGLLTQNGAAGEASSIWPWPEQYSYFGRKIMWVDDGTDDGVLYSTIARSGSEFVGESSGQLYRSDDGGGNWYPLPMPGKVNYVSDFAYDPADPETVYIGCWQSTNGNPNYLMCDEADLRYNSGGVYVTNDGGGSWRLLWGADRHVYGIQVDPYNPSNIFVVTFEGQMMVSEDRGESWTQLYGFNFRQASSPFIDPNHPDFIFVSSFGGNIWRGPSGVSPKLGAIEIDGEAVEGVGPEIYEYNIEVPYWSETIELTVSGVYHTAFVTGGGEKELAVGKNVFAVTIENELKTLSTSYIITVERIGFIDAYIVEDGRNQSTVSFPIRSANGKNYSVFIKADGADEFERYPDVNFNANGAHIKGLAEGATYWAYIEYNDGAIIERSDVFRLCPSQTPGAGGAPEKEVYEYVTFVMNGGELVGEWSPSQNDWGYSLPDPYRTNYAFAGWYDNPVFDGARVFGVEPVEGEFITLYAKWELSAVVSNGNGQSSINFKIVSPNGKGYTVYIANDWSGPYAAYPDASYNANGAQIKKLENGKIYYAYVVYNNGSTVETTEIVKLEPSK